MKIICGTDFSEKGGRAATVAALLAQRTGGELDLLHVLDTRGLVFNVGSVLEAFEEASREQLKGEAGRLAGLGARVQPDVLAGWPDECLLAEARARRGELVVLSALGRRDGAGVRVGKTCERVLSDTEVPMLALRDPAPLEAWLRGDRALKVMVAYDGSATAEAALRWAERLAELGNAQLLAACVDDPVREAARMGLGASSQGEAQERLRERVANDVARVVPNLPVEVIVSSHLGDPAARLAHLAEREAADLVIVGSHQRGAMERLVSGSVSLDLLRDSPVSVLVVPRAAAQAAAAVEAPAVRTVLVATDLSDIGRRAAAMGFAVAPAGSTVKLVTVLNPFLGERGRYGRPSDPAFQREHAKLRAEREAALNALLPADAQAHGRSVSVEVVEHEDAARAIAEQAELVSADLVVMGTLGRSGLAAAILGSVAQDVLKLCRRPLLLVQPPKD